MPVSDTAYRYWRLALAKIKIFLGIFLQIFAYPIGIILCIPLLPIIAVYVVLCEFWWAWLGLGLFAALMGIEVPAVGYNIIIGILGLVGKYVLPPTGAFLLDVVFGSHPTN